MDTIIEEAGAIVLRKGSIQPEVLLIYSKKRPQIRIFPKGHIEPGETSAEAAGRELLEEAGVKGKLLEQAGVVTFEFNKKRYRVTYFYFTFLGTISEGEAGREPRWFSLADARMALSLEDLRELVTPVAVERSFV